MAKSKTSSLPGAAGTPGAVPLIRDLLGPPALLSGEDRGGYEALSQQIMAAVRPADALEQIWVEDAVYRIWEVMRLRRLKSALFESSAHQGLGKVLTPIMHYSDRERLVGAWAKGEQAAYARVAEVLDAAGLVDETIMAETLAVRLDTFEKIDRMIVVAENRRDAALRELERHRDTLARRLREAAQNIPDAEFTEIPSVRDAAE